MGASRQYQENYATINWSKRAPQPPKVVAPEASHLRSSLPMPNLVINEVGTAVCNSLTHPKDMKKNQPFLVNGTQKERRGQMQREVDRRLGPDSGFEVHL